MVEWAGIVSAFLGILFTAVGAGIVGQLALQSLRRLYEGGKEETVSDRVDRLTRSLKEAIYLIDQIEGGIRARQALATKLKEDVQSYQRPAALKVEEVGAVAHLLRAELHSETRRSCWHGAAQNSLLFLLGVLVTVVVAVVFSVRLVWWVESGTLTSCRLRRLPCYPS